MFKVKSKTKEQRSPQSQQKLEQVRLNHNQLQKRKGNRKQKAANQIQTKARHLFPGWVLIKSITSQKNNQFYRGQPYIRDVKSAWQSRKAVQMTEEDLNFIDSNKGKFVYEEVELLNQYLLTQFLQFLHDNKKQNESAQNIGTIFRKWIQRDDLPHCYVFCQAFKVENPLKFEQFVGVISQHCHYNFIKHTQFQTNAYYYKFKLFQDRQLLKPYKKNRKPLNTTQNVKHQIKKQREFLQKHINQYSDLYNQHLKEKQKLFKHIQTVFRILKDKGLCSKIKLNRQDWTLDQLHKTLTQLLKRHQQKCNVEFYKIVKKSKQQQNKKQSQKKQKEQSK